MKNESSEWERVVSDIAPDRDTAEMMANKALKAAQEEYPNRILKVVLPLFRSSSDSWGAVPWHVKAQKAGNAKT